MEECIHLLNNFTFSRIYFELLFVGFWTIVSKMFSFQPPEQSGGLPTQVWFSSDFHYLHVQPLIVLKLFLKFWENNCFAQIGNKTECALLGFVMDLGVDYQKVGTLFYYCRRHHQKDPKSLSTSSSARPDLGKLLPFVESAQRNFLFVQIIRYIPAHLSRKHFLNIFLKRRPNSHFKILSYKCAWKAGFR